MHFDVFHRLAHRVVMANLAQTVNVLQAVLLADAATGALVRTPTFHVFEMNRVHHDAVAVPVHVRAAEGTFSASASVADGRCHVSVANLDLERAADVVIEIRGARVGAVGGRLLAPSSVGAFNAVGHPDDVAPRAIDELVVTAGTVRVTVPPHAFAVVGIGLPDAQQAG